MRKFALLLLLVLAACRSEPMAPPGSTRPTHATRIEPPAVYAERYRAMEECAGLRGDFSRVRWYAVPGRSWHSTFDQRRVAAEWWPPHDIYIAEQRLSNLAVVDHEILHDILRSGEHPEPPFGVCAPLAPSGRP